MVVEIKNLSFKYDESWILKDVNLCVNAGDFVAITGSNGTGKSTLIKLLLKEINPQSGEIILFNQDIKFFHDWTKIGYIKQNGVESGMSFPGTPYEIVSSNLYSHLGFFKFLNKSQKALVDESLRIVNLSSQKNKLFSQLSGGQMQKVMVARCLVGNPSIMILDEPTSAMDEKSISEFYDLIRKINVSNKITIIIITHDISRVSSFVNKIYDIENSQVKEIK